MDKMDKTNKKFWSFIKPFTTYKGMIVSDDITVMGQ